MLEQGPWSSGPLSESGLGTEHSKAEPASEPARDSRSEPESESLTIVLRWTKAAASCPAAPACNPKTTLIENVVLKGR